MKRATKIRLAIIVPLLVAFFGGILITLPRFKDLYNEMIPGEPLPTLTNIFCAIPLPVYAALMLMVIAAVLIGNYAIKSPAILWKLNLVLGLCGVLGILLYGMAIFLPLTRIHHGGLGQ